MYVGTFLLLSRALTRTLQAHALYRPMQGSPEIPALTVLPRPWDRARPLKGDPNTDAVHVSVGANVYRLRVL